MRAANKRKCDVCHTKIAKQTVTDPQGRVTYLCIPCGPRSGLGGKVGYTYGSANLGYWSNGKPISPVLETTL